ncbi:MAG: fasciclin domain-containing protein [Roseomonas sp.]|nr:fasciclin domain-containing protein [Roseomonas sp.]MCA3379313.1 fasciclin domain-containing protein [Roseomonas sp.]
MLSRRSLFAVGGAALFLNGCERVLPDGRFPLMDVMGAEPSLSNFRAALRSSGLAAELLERPGIYTVLAPTNLAWSGSPERIRLGERDALLNLIAGGRLRLPDIQARGGRIRMLSGIEVRVVGGTAENPRIQGARPGQAPSGASASIIRSNLLASNGVVHVVEGVLIPT